MGGAGAASGEEDQAAGEALLPTGSERARAVCRTGLNRKRVRLGALVGALARARLWSPCRRSWQGRGKPFGSERLVTVASSLRR